MDVQIRRSTPCLHLSVHWSAHFRGLLWARLMWLPQGVTPLQVEIPLTGADRRALGVRGAGAS